MSGPFVAACALGMALLVLGLRLRRRRGGALPPVPADVARFVRLFRSALAERHEDVRWRGVVPGRFTAILEVDGQETPVALHATMRQWEAFPDALAQLVDRLLAEVREDGLEQPYHREFAEVATSILPQIRSVEWLRGSAPRFGDGALVHREFEPDLAVCYVIDDEWTMTFVCAAHLRRWGRTEADLFHLATANLYRAAGSGVPVPGPDDDPVLVRVGDGYDASRVLLVDTSAAEGRIVALPDRDVLWLGDAADERDLASLQVSAAEHSARSRHPVSPNLYRVRDGRLTVVTPARRSV